MTRKPFMRLTLRMMLLLLAVFGSIDGARAEGPGVTIPPELILQRFAVNKGGDALLVPVKIAGKDRLFVVDTGCTTTVVEESLPLGEPQRVVTADTPAGKVNVRLYRVPEASVGGLPLGVDEVMGVDLKWIRELFGYPIEGILGMDFLGRYVVHIDFDRGELLLLKSVPKDSGEVVPIRSNSGGLPELKAWISPQQDVQFLIDTGWISHDSGKMERGSLSQSGDFEKVGSSLSETASGTHASSEFRGKRISLGGFSVDQPIFDESPTMSLLGLGFWSRFVVTFDFPNQNMYLRKGKGYERPDLRDLSGLHLLRRDGAVVVHSVDKGSTGSLAGLQAGDKLLILGSSRADETSLFDLKTALCQPGTLKCSMRRGSEERSLTLNLPR
jgi:predicted aspartyl protease